MNLTRIALKNLTATFACGLSLLLIPVGVEANSPPFSTDCRALLGFHNAVAINTGSTNPTERYRFVDPEAGKGSLAVLPGFGTFIIENKMSSGGATHVAQYISPNTLQSLLRFPNSERNDPEGALHALLSKFVCISENTYLKETLETQTEAVTNQVTASEKRLTEALMWNYSLQLSSIESQLDAITSQIGALPNSDAEALSAKIEVISSFAKSSFQQVCSVMGQDTEACKQVEK